MKHVTHWIGGKPWTGTAQRHGDIYDPATGQVSGTVDFAAPEEVDDAVAAAAEAFKTWRRTSLAKRATTMFAFRELVKAHTEELAKLITSEHGKVASDAAGEVARGLEVVEFACGIPHLLKGGFSENVSTSVDVVLDQAAGRGGRGHHPVQLPGHGADVDVPDRDRLRQHVRAQAVGEGPVRVAAARPPVGRGGTARRRVQRGARRQGRGRRAADPPGNRRGQLRRVHADRPVRLRDRHQQRQAGAGARRGEEPHDRAARRRPGPGGRRGGERRLRLGGRAVHGHLGARRRRTRSATSSSPRSRTGSAS